MGALVSFQEGSDLLKKLAGVEVEAKQVERTAEGLGAEVVEDKQRRVEPDRREPLPSTLYLGIDGTGVPMRSSELRGRTGKQARQLAGENSGGETVHRLECRIPRCRRPPGAGRGLGDLFSGH